jgi:hypothetical protein
MAKSFRPLSPFGANKDEKCDITLHARTSNSCHHTFYDANLMYSIKPAFASFPHIFLPSSSLPSSSLQFARSPTRLNTSFAVKSSRSTKSRYGASRIRSGSQAFHLSVCWTPTYCQLTMAILCTDKPSLSCRRLIAIRSVRETILYDHLERRESCR